MKQEYQVKRSTRLYILICACLAITTLLLLCSTVTFVVLYVNKSAESPKCEIETNQTSLPHSPPPSNSPLGVFSRAAVAADNGYCSEIGRNILLKGGNAVDAAIATMFCQGVMGSASSGIGGGHFMTIYNATTGRCHVIDAREVAPLAATEDMFVNRWNESENGWRAIAVPGEIHGMWTEYTNFGGDLPWSQLVQPTIDLLDVGIPISDFVAEALLEKRDIIKNEPTLWVLINPETHDVYKFGEQVTTRKTLMNTLKILANATNPAAEFYNGSIAAQIVAEFRNNGGLITAADLAAYRSIIRDDSEVIYTELSNGRHICGPPPPSSSAVAQAILNILDGYEHNETTFDGNVDIYHRFIEASKFAFAARSMLGDMAFVGDALAIAKNITSKSYADAIRALITDRAHPDAYYGGKFASKEDHGTTHISVIDRHGNAVAITETINLFFGAKVRSNTTGIIWNDEMDDFSTPGHPNEFDFPPSPTNFIQPGKRPQSSMSPIVIFDDKQALLAVGGAGGATIISGTSAVALQSLWLHKDIKQAMDAPRVHNQLEPNRTQFEHRLAPEYVAALTDRGHNMVSTSAITEVTAVQSTTTTTKGGGHVYANSDYRKGGESYAAGY